MSENKGTCDMTRRHALKVTVQGGLVFVCALLAGEEAEGASGWVSAGKVTQFKIGTPKRVILPGGSVVFVLHENKNQWKAVSARCTHEGGEVRWEGAQKRFICPLHGATFAANGTSPTGPARRPLAALKTKIQGDSVQVDTTSVQVGKSAGGRKRHGEKKHEEEEHGEHKGRERGEKDDD